MIRKYNEKAGMGAEPIHIDPILNINDARLANSFSWYSYFYTINEGRVWITEYLKNSKTSPEKIRLFNKAETKEIDSSTCWIARMVNQGMKLPQVLIDKHNKKIDNIIANQNTQDDVVVVDNKFNIQDRIREKNNAIAGDIEAQVDAFINSKYVENNFDAYSFLKLNPPSSKNIINYYNKLLEEIDMAIDGREPSLIEGYSNMKKKQLKSYQKFILTIVDDMNRFFNNKSAARVKKPRKKKEKSSIQLTNKVQYKKEDNELKLVSSNPANIIGASSIWLFNTKTKKLTNIQSSGAQGLSVKGTTIINMDDKLSMSKVVRKPADVLPQILNGGKIVLKNILANLTTKETEVNGRMNSDTIILRYIK